VQVGGGVRTSERLDALLDRGALHVVVGTRAFEDPDWIADQAERHPGRIIVAADTRSRRIAVRGWSRTLALDVIDAIREMHGLPLAGALVTAIDVEGSLGGPDLELIGDIVEQTAIPVIASGGIASLDDLRALADCGARGAVLGMALYTGTLDARAVAEEFGGEGTT
jgi:phosphoribosylformimino-5-aminoimidazole carboxamide ribotide isomerase